MTKRFIVDIDLLAMTGGTTLPGSERIEVVAPTEADARRLAFQAATKKFRAAFELKSSIAIQSGGMTVTEVAPPKLTF